MLRGSCLCGGVRLGDRARRRKCRLMQLASDKARPDAIRFYESPGLIASHEGMKLHIEVDAT